MVVSERGLLGVFSDVKKEGGLESGRRDVPHEGRSAGEDYESTRAETLFGQKYRYEY